jgi:tetratricopeptide (TPR) repeat protein
VSGLILQAHDVEGRDRWRWELLDGNGPIAAHQVRFGRDVARWAATAPAAELRRRIVEEILGAEITAAIDAQGASTLHVEVPRSAFFLLDVPLSCALARPVSVAYLLPQPHRPDPRPSQGRLRVLALPAAGADLSPAVRRDQQRLSSGLPDGRAEIRRLSHRLDREQVHEIIDDYPGWDVLHLTTHGGVGALVLDSATGQPDLVSGGDLLKLLRPLRGRLRLIVISACRSGSADVSGTLARLGAGEVPRPRPRLDGETGPMEWAALAAEQLGAPVLTTRFPTDGPFAAAVYERVLVRGATLEEAAAEAGGQDPAAHPVVLGADPGVRITVLTARTTVDPTAIVDSPAAAALSLPPRSERFVGRRRELNLAAAALAPGSGRAGLLLMGAGGSGKTACVLEAAYQFGDRFAPVVWWSADGTAAALTSLAFALESALRVPAVQAVASEPELRRFLPNLRSVLCHRPALLVLDNLETALTADGHWRDGRLGRLIEALTGHGGESRVLMTSRVEPQPLHPDVMVVEIDRLSYAETVEVAHQLRNLASLLDEGTASGPEASRLARILLDLPRGHPRMLELIDAAASNPDALVALLDARDAGDPLLRLSDLFPHEAAGEEPAEFRRALAGWVELLLAGLPPDAKHLLDLLALLDEEDRVRFVVEAAWSALSPDRPVGNAFATLSRLGLIEAGEGDKSELVRLHDGVPGPVRTSMDTATRRRVCEALADLWLGLARSTLRTDGSEAAEFALRAAPYQLRVKRWPAALEMLLQAERQDRSPTVTSRVLDHLAALRDVVTGEQDRLRVEAVEAQVRLRLDPVEGVERLAAILKEAQAHDPALASDVAGYLTRVLLERGDAEAALSFLERKKRLTQRAGLDRWALALDECQRLRIQHSVGRDSEALAGALALLADLGHAPPPADPELSWRTRESAWAVAYQASVTLEDWLGALAHNRRILDSLTARKAGGHERAWVAFNLCTPLLRLGRLEEAQDTLSNCYQVFNRTRDARALGAVFSALADLDSVRGGAEEASEIERQALRLKYFAADPDSVAASHHNLAGYLIDQGTDIGQAVAHRIAAGMLLLVTRRGVLRTTVRALAGDLKRFGQDPLPPSLEACVSRVQAVAGVQFADLLTTLVPDAERQRAAFRATVETALRADGRPEGATRLPAVLSDS